MTVPMVNVFVSSTWHDLQPERAAVEAALQRLRETKFVGMKYSGSRAEDTRRTSLDEVDRCQVYVGIFGGRYGSGITEAEYRRARELGLHCHIYFKDEDRIAPEWKEQDPEKAIRLTVLKAELLEKHTITIFTTPDDLATKVTADLHRWLFDEYLAPRLEQAAQHGNEAKIRSLIEAVLDKEALRQTLEQRGISIGRDVVQSLLIHGSHNVINFIVQGIVTLPTDYATRIQNFLTEYLGTLERPVPFGGREADLARLDAWLDDPTAPPYLLLAGVSACWTRTTLP
jgi:hypothetical protein